MFYAIRRMLKLCILLFFGWVGVVVYQNRHVFEPVAIWYEVWENDGLKKAGLKDEPLPVISGKASLVLDSRSFNLQRARMPLFALRLAGLDEPNLTPLTLEAAKVEGERKIRLKELIQGQVVNVEVTYHSGHSGLGICHRGKTNINLHLIKEGFAELKPQYIKPLPAKIQYEFFQARRIAQKKLELKKETAEKGTNQSAL